MLGCIGLMSICNPALQRLNTVHMQLALHTDQWKPLHTTFGRVNP